MVTVSEGYLAGGGPCCSRRCRSQAWRGGGGGRRRHALGIVSQNALWRPGAAETCGPPANGQPLDLNEYLPAWDAQTCPATGMTTSSTTISAICIQLAAESTRPW